MRKLKKEIKMEKRTIILTGGGTGGHVVPNISLLPYLKKHFDKIFYIGTNGIEKEMMSGKVDKFFEIKAFKLRRDKKLANLLLPFRLLGSIRECKKILKKTRPSVIFSKGGYVSVPVCIASKMLKIPIVSHESDLSLGLANKVICRLSNTLCTTFEKTAQNIKKGVFTGSPIRKELFEGQKEKGYQITSFDGKRKIILFTGGSTGAKGINDCVFASIELLTNKYDIIHLVGKGKGQKINNPHYCQMEFCSQIEHLFAIADIVVTRAGSNAIYELLAISKPMLLIPLPKGSSRGDQVENAKYFEQKGYARILYQENLNSKTLLDNIDDMIANQTAIQNKLQQIPKRALINGAENITKEILKSQKNAQK